MTVKIYVKGKAGRPARIEWLREHESLWRPLLRADEDWVHDPPEELKRALVEGMRKDGLVARTTYWKDVQILHMLADLVRERRDGV